MPGRTKPGQLLLLLIYSYHFNSVAEKKKKHQLAFYTLAILTHNALFEKRKKKENQHMIWKALFGPFLPFIASLLRLFVVICLYFLIATEQTRGESAIKRGSVCNGSFRINLASSNPLSTQVPPPPLLFFSCSAHSSQIISRWVQPIAFVIPAKALKVLSRCSSRPSGQKQNKLLIPSLNGMKQVWISLFN